MILDKYQRRSCGAAGCPLNGYWGCKAIIHQVDVDCEQIQAMTKEEAKFVYKIAKTVKKLSGGMKIVKKGE